MRLRSRRICLKAIPVRLQSTDVQHWMDLERRWKLEFICISSNHSLNVKWSNESLGELGSASIAHQLEMIRGEEDLVTDGEGDITTMLIRIFPLPFLRFLNGSLGFRDS